MVSVGALALFFSTLSEKVNPKREVEHQSDMGLSLRSAAVELYQQVALIGKNGERLLQHRTALLEGCDHGERNR